MSRFEHLTGNTDMIPRPHILGVPVDAINMRQTVDRVAAWIEHRESHYICITPAHSIMDCRDDPELRAIFSRSGLSTPDGMAVVWLLKLMGYKQVTRVYGPDLLLALCEFGLSRDWGHYFYGGHIQVLEDLVYSLRSRFPTLKVSGVYSPPFGPISDRESNKIINDINTAQPEIIWVGLGAPKQEHWMDAHRSRLHAPVMIGVGAAFDFLSGNKSQAPVRIQRLGLEWLFRLLSEPARLWPRYRRYPYFAWLALGQLLGLTSRSSNRNGKV